MTESFIVEYLNETGELLPPLQRESVVTEVSELAGADAIITTHLKNNPSQKFQFLVEVKSKNSPKIVQGAIHQIKSCHKKKNDPEMHPMIVVPYLSEARLHELEEEQVSGIDLCGNGIVTIPNRLLVFRTGQQNQFPQSRPLNNPYRGKSAMVGRAFLAQRDYDSLGALHDFVQANGSKLSLSQVSKAVKALEDDLIVSSVGRKIQLRDPLRLMDQLSSEWRWPREAKMALRLASPLDALSRLSKVAPLQWAVTGESSAQKYVSFGQGRPLRVAVSNIRKAWDILEGEKEEIPGFADVELYETSEAGFFFQNQMDPTGIRWASRIQTWIELKNGDGRSQDAARELQKQIINDIETWK